MSFKNLQENTCTLTGFPSKDPYPSLVTCYKYNNEACCLSVHDNYIQEQLSTMLTDSCLGKYNELEDLMCLGCHPFEMAYISENESGKKELKICKEFAKRLWDATTDEELNLPTMKYDNCGFKSGFFDSEMKTPYIIPSKNFTNINQFLKKLAIPFYESIEIVISDDTNNCYNYKEYLSLNLILLALSVMISFL